jgi:hypothetical protein
MKLTVFQADKGDCLLVEGADGKRMLVDGGIAASFREHVAPTLGALREAKQELDVVCVTHVDEDHIGGVLALLDAEVDWRVHDYQLASGNTRHRAPAVPRPPAVKEIWHNGFGEQVDGDLRAIADLLTQSAGALDLSDADDLRALAERHRELAHSAGHAIRLSRRTGPRQLGIPLNAAFDGKLALVREHQPALALGSLELVLLAPFAEDVERFRAEWRDWVERNQAELARIRARTQRDIERLDFTSSASFRDAIALRPDELGDRKKVTAPNLASLMFLAREGNATLLLTGDGHADDLIRGLEHAGVMAAGGTLHVDALKLPHHGSEFNVTPEFCRRVTADHYIVCANGAHENPDLRVLKALLEARAEADEPFKLWFSSSPRVAKNAANREHMAAVVEFMEAAAREQPGRFECEFLEDSSFELALG